MSDRRRVRAAGSAVRRVVVCGVVLVVAAGLVAPAAPAAARPGHEQGPGPALADSNPTITLTVSPGRSSFHEKSASVYAAWLFEIKATLDGGARSTDTTVNLFISAGGTATHGTDYKGGLFRPPRVTIAAGKSSAWHAMDLRIFDDTVDEGDETIIIAGTADGFTVNPATITIVDNDFPSTSATLSVSPARLLESAEATEVTVTAKLDNGVRSADVSVSLTLEGTATAADYTYTPATLPTLTIAAGSLSTSEKITVDPVGDDVDDNRDTVVVSGSVSSVSGFTVAGATIELLDFPPPAAVTDLRASVAGDGEARLEWSRPSGPVDGYRLERHYGHTLDEPLAGEAVSPLLGPAATSYLDGGLTSRKYQYRIFAFNDSGESPASNWAEAVVREVPSPSGGSPGPGQGSGPGPGPRSGGGGAGPPGPEPEPEEELSFEDVEPSSALAPGIVRAVSLGIFTETEPGRFSPRQIMSRVDVAAALVRLWQALVRSCPQEGSMPFDDVGPEARADVACLYALGITQGTTATTFSPGRSVTRAEMASLLIRLWRLTGRDCPAEAALAFEDVSQNSVHRDSIVCLHALGITQGTSATTFSPHRLLTRGEVATMAARLHDLTESVRS